jgi:hypothetical protein
MSGKADLPHGDRFEEGKEHSHQAGDSKDQRSIANRLAAEERKDENAGDSKETALSKEDPTLPVRPPKANPTASMQYANKVRNRPSHTGTHLPEAPGLTLRSRPRKRQSSTT